MKPKIVVIVSVCMFLLPAFHAYGYQITVTPRISIGEEYTDNYFQTKQNKENEFITTISPGLSAQLLGKTMGADISYDPEYAAYDKHTENNLWRHTLQFLGWLKPSKNTKIDLRNTFFKTEDPQTDADVAAIRTQDPTAPIDSTIRKGRNSYSRNSTRLNLTYQFGAFDSINLGYNYSFLNNSDPTVEDNRRHNPFIGLTYWLLPRWGLDLKGSYTKGEFDTSDDSKEWTGSLRLVRKFTKNLKGHVGYSQTILNYDGVTQDEKTYNPFIGMDYSIANDISFVMDVGYYINDYDLSGSTTGLTVDGRCVKTLRRGAVSLAVLGGYDHSMFDAENLGFEKFAESSVSATYQFAKTVSGNVFGSYRYSKYTEIIPERKDDTAKAGLGLSIQPLRWLFFSLNYTFSSVNSSIDTNDYDENRISIKVTVSPPQPYLISH